MGFPTKALRRKVNIFVFKNRQSDCAVDYINRCVFYNLKRDNYTINYKGRKHILYTPAKQHKIADTFLSLLFTNEYKIFLED